jgi:hypothetical protein
MNMNWGQSNEGVCEGTGAHMGKVNTSYNSSQVSHQWAHVVYLYGRSRISITMFVMSLSNHYITTHHSHGSLRTFVIYIYFRVEPITSWHVFHAWPPRFRDLRRFATFNVTLRPPVSGLSGSPSGTHTKSSDHRKWNFLFLQNKLQRCINKFILVNVSARGETFIRKTFVAFVMHPQQRHHPRAQWHRSSGWFTIEQFLTTKRPTLSTSQLPRQMTATSSPSK